VKPFEHAVSHNTGHVGSDLEKGRKKTGI